MRGVLSLAVLEQVPNQVNTGKNDDGVKNPIEHLRHVELLAFGVVVNLRIPHAESCRPMFTSGSAAWAVEHRAVWLKSRPNLALLSP
jgi:hypothetical protein